jgi:hypothetical protein
MKEQWLAEVQPICRNAHEYFCFFCAPSSGSHGSTDRFAGLDFGMQVHGTPGECRKSVRAIDAKHGIQYEEPNYI